MSEFEDSQLLPLAVRVYEARGWDGKMRELMLAGKQLPILDDAQRVSDNQVQGCESDVWVDLLFNAPQPQFRGYSESKIIRGILSILLERANSLPLTHIVEADFPGYLQQIGLDRYLSQSRGNGVRALIARIRLLADNALQ